MMNKAKKVKKAFTLAETLIVLAIIGVVASLTIPAVIRSTTQDQYVTALKKANTILNQLMEASVMQNGAVKNWAVYDASGSATYSTATFFEKYFMPYLDLNQDCETGSGCFGTPTDGYKNLTVKGTECIDMDSNKNYYKVILADGMSVAYMLNCSSVPTCASTSDPVGIIYVDINGPKEPNLCGRDMFRFEVYPHTNNIKPTGIYDSTNVYNPAIRVRKLSTTDPVCESTNASGCAAKVLREGGMNY